MYLAVERTFLAWIRTGIALMGFGFVVARFGIFLHEVSAVAATVAPRSHGFSVWAGTGIMMTGVMILALAVIQHYRTIQRLNQNVSITGKPSLVGMILAGMLALIGLGITGYLMSLG